MPRKPDKKHHNEVQALMKRCQIGVGGKGALDQAHDIMAECYGALGKMDSEIRRLRDALKDIAQLGSYYGKTPVSIAKARKALGCKHMPYKTWHVAEYEQQGMEVTRRARRAP